MKKPLSQMKKGESGYVCQILFHGAFKKRIIDMGITVGTEINVGRVAPFGDPIIISLRGFMLGIRKNEAENIIIGVN